MILQKLKRAAENYLSEKVTDAVITVQPTSMIRSGRQRRTQAKLPDST